MIDGGDEAIDRALEILRSGGLVAIPTETVYGLAADASNADAVRRIFEVKGRPGDHPLIVHITDAGELGRWAASVPPAAARLAETCWPGPLTLLLRRRPTVLDVVTGGRATVGLRVPAHPVALDLLRRFGGGLAAPSANRFGRVSPTTADHVLADLGSDVDLILDGGACPVGVESTIVDCTTDPPQLLRPGAITAEQIGALIDSGIDGAEGASRAPGMLESHYAPAARVTLVESAAAAASELDEAARRGQRAELIDVSDDLPAYARTLYDRLRAADERCVDLVVAVLPAATGLGHAIRDRLIKAAAPRAR